MRPAKLIYYSFVCFCLFFVALNIYDLQFVRPLVSSAGGFGISPPAIFFELRAGEAAAEQITLLRSGSRRTFPVFTRIAESTISPWLRIGDDIAFAPESTTASAQIAVSAPPEAEPDVYRGHVYFIAGGENGSGVGVNLGARLNIEVRIIKETVTLADDLNSLAINDLSWHEEYRGEFVRPDNGPLYYVDLSEPRLVRLSEREEVFRFIRSFGLGARSDDLAAIPLDFGCFIGPDADNDGVPDEVEFALGTNPDSVDTDQDGFSDYGELLNGYNALGPGAGPVEYARARQQAGKILLQVESRGQAWYIRPHFFRRCYLPLGEELTEIIGRISWAVEQDEIERITN